MQIGGEITLKLSGAQKKEVREGSTTKALRVMAHKSSNTKIPPDLPRGTAKESLKTKVFKQT